MTKSELVQKLAKANPDLQRRDAEVIVATIFHELVAALTRGDRVELRGFGAFALKRQEPRVSRNLPAPVKRYRSPRNASHSLGLASHCRIASTGKVLQSPDAPKSSDAPHN
jgi:nucleoid DNA-binding protein